MVLLIFISLLSNVVFGVDDVNNYDSLRVRSVISIPVEFERTDARADFDYLNLDYYWLPLEDYRQSVVSSVVSPSGDFRDGGVFLTVDRPVDFVFEAQVVTDTFSFPVKIKEKVLFPLKNLDSDLIDFTKETDLIDFDGDIKALASKLAKGEDDLFVVVFKLADWVNSNIDYNLSTVTKDASLPSSWVLKNRRGVCDEMSNLFISMVRSLGIPARSVSGIAYTDSELFDENWGAHGWAEVYFPDYGWVPFDPTYNQLGFVDSTHIKLEEGLDSDKFNVKYSWRASGYDVVPGNQKISSVILNKGNQLKSNIGVSVEFFEEEVSFGSFNVVKAKVSNLEDYYVALGISLGSVENLKNIDELTKDILLKPGETREISWTVKLDGSFNEDYIYTFPIVIYTFSGFNVSSNFKASDSGIFVSSDVASAFSIDDAEDIDSNILFSCALENDVVYVGDVLNIGCSVEFEDASNIRVCLDGECKVVTANDYDDISFSKFFDEPGFFTFVVTAKKLSFSEQSFLTVNVLDDVDIKFSDVVFPSSVGFDDLVVFNFSLEKNSSSNPKNVNVSIFHDNFVESFFVKELLGKQSFIFNFPAKNLDAGENYLDVSVSFFDDAGKEINLSKSFRIDLIDLSFGQRILLWFNSIGSWLDSLI